MNINQLKNELINEQIPNNWYSINDESKSDVLVLKQIKIRKEHYSYWEFFYIDERGNKDNAYKRFEIESEACEFLLRKLLYKKQHFKTWEDYNMNKAII